MSFGLPGAFGTGFGRLGGSAAQSSSGIPGWVMPGAIIDEDFVNGRYYPRPVAEEIVDTRASTKYVTTAAGLIVSIPVNTLPISTAGMLIEPARTNLLTYTEDFDGTDWDFFDTILTLNAGTSPDGTNNAAQLEEANTDLHHFGWRNYVDTLDEDYTFSAYFKPAGRDWICFNTYDGSSDTHTYFNVTTGTIGDIEPGWTAQIEPMSGGWYRCSITGPMNANTDSFWSFFTALNNGATQHNGTLGTGFLNRGPQVELASDASSYVPVIAGTPATRAADSAVIQRTGIGRVVYTFDDDTTQEVSGINTGVPYAIPTNLNRRLIKRLTGYAS